MDGNSIFSHHWKYSGFRFSSIINNYIPRCKTISFYKHYLYFVLEDESLIKYSELVQQVAPTKFTLFVCFIHK